MRTDADTHRCELCGQERVHGSLLVVREGTDPVWVCEDCQRKLALKVDDEGTAGD